jgi:hypothetical protein
LFLINIKHASKINTDTASIKKCLKICIIGTTFSVVNSISIPLCNRSKPVKNNHGWIFLPFHKFFGGILLSLRKSINSLVEPITLGISCRGLAVSEVCSRLSQNWRQIEGNPRQMQRTSSFQTRRRKIRRRRPGNERRQKHPRRRFCRNHPQRASFIPRWMHQPQSVPFSPGSRAGTDWLAD